MTKELTQEEINLLLKNIELDDAAIKKDTWKANLANAMLGVNKGKPGRILTTAEREHLASIKRPKSESTRIKLSKKGRNAGRIQTEEEKSKRAISGLGKNLGKTQTTESRILMGREKSKYIYETPGGEMLSRVEVHMKYVSPELTTNQLDRFIGKNLNGFSRRLKENV
jgi:hypothetical protein